MGLDRRLRKWLENRFRERVRFDEPMARHTSFRMGGPADAFVRPGSIVALRDLLAQARQADAPVFIMGGGTNLLVRDGGIRGIVIALGRGMDRVHVQERGKEEVRVRVMAGTHLAKLCRMAIDKGLAGLQFALGIPGTVGGGLRMNAGTRHGAMSDAVEAIELMSPYGEIDRVEKKDIAFAYRHMALGVSPEDKRHGSLILGADILLHLDDSERLRREADAILAERWERQPTGASAGCFFKNPSPDQSAGMLIDRAGLRGRRIGNVEISDRHANFFINRGGGRAADAIALMETAQSAVQAIFNIQLTPEVQIVGSEK